MREEMQSEHQTKTLSVFTSCRKENMYVDVCRYMHSFSVSVKSSQQASSVCLSVRCQRIIHRDKKSSITLSSGDVRGSGRDFSCLWSICASQSRRVDKPGQAGSRSGARTAMKGRMRFHRSRNREPVSHRCHSGVRHSLLVRRSASCPVLRRVPEQRQQPRREAFPERRPSKHLALITATAKATPHLRQSQSCNQLNGVKLVCIYSWLCTLKTLETKVLWLKTADTNNRFI